jgi:uncharacterized protein (DUF58 family)
MSKSTPERILQRLDWTVIRRLDGILQGNYRTLFYGQGLDLADIREYQFGDDVRAIDWNVTARMTTPYIRQYLEDREVNAWFLLDLSPSVDFGTVRTLKRNLLIDFVTTMARLLTRRGNKVGAVLYDSQVQRVIPAGSSKLHVLRLINDLVNTPKLPRAPLTDLSVLLTAAYRAIQRRSLVFIVSDFFSKPGWDKPLGLLARRHEVLVARLCDPRESELPDIGVVFMEDAESGEQIYLDTADRKFRERFHQAAEKREYELNTMFRRAGIDVLELSTEEDLVRAIVRFATVRKQRKRQSATAGAAVR